MIHIKETEIIPLLKNAQAEYSQKITEGNPKDVEMAERIEEALTQAMDIVYDYQSMADEHKRMVEKYETEAPVIKRGMDFYCCPACGKRTSRNHTHCHWCGKKLGVGQMKQEITMGSLFSGSGGFELAGSIFGIRPIWASEIEPFPILVTTKNFPEMKHLGDINKLNGADLEPVTIIAGGSPCQDMSIAGKREGLDGSRSNLFREQIRIIKEMRESDRATGRTGKQIRPRYMVWENVPGAYSSNKGEDFRCVLEEICQISEGNVSIPRPPKNKWGGQGAIMGDGYSVAWRTLDAQYWGVPQRRKRIYLVADFGGDTAPEILFVREGLSGNFAESREAWQRTAGDIKTGTHKTGADDVECYDISDRRRVADRSEVSPTLTTKMGTGGNNVPIVLENHPQDSRVTIAEDGNVPTLTSRMGTGGGAMCHLSSANHIADQKRM